MTENHWGKVAACYIVAILNPDDSVSNDYGVFFYNTRNIAFETIEEFDIRENERYTIDRFRYGKLVESWFYDNQKKQIDYINYEKQEEK